MSGRIPALRVKFEVQELRAQLFFTRELASKNLLRTCHQAEDIRLYMRLHRSLAWIGG